MNNEFIRIGLIMYLLPNCAQEYERRHDEIWPELLKLLKQHGGRNYSIFLDKNSNQLFAYVEIKNEKVWSDLANTDVCQKWWRYMKDIMKTNPDNSPMMTMMRSVFYMK
ncbi:L-rhamnose mutarotase [Psychromonas sp. MME2]|uniref:L-rhamnose mutarotase n=1 Tax=unclassified Psychromonas TaxID=2614957 RepID=UPI00339BCD94